jgi:hypothetical protein
MRVPHATCRRLGRVPACGAARVLGPTPRPAACLWGCSSRPPIAASRRSTAAPAAALTHLGWLSCAAAPPHDLTSGGCKALPHLLTSRGCPALRCRHGPSRLHLLAPTDCIALPPRHIPVARYAHTGTDRPCRAGCSRGGAARDPK